MGEAEGIRYKENGRKFIFAEFVELAILIGVEILKFLTRFYKGDI